MQATVYSTLFSRIYFKQLINNELLNLLWFYFAQSVCGTGISSAVYICYRYKTTITLENSRFLSTKFFFPKQLVIWSEFEWELIFAEMKAWSVLHTCSDFISHYEILAYDRRKCTAAFKITPFVENVFQNIRHVLNITNCMFWVHLKLFGWNDELICFHFNFRYD